MPERYSAPTPDNRFGGSARSMRDSEEHVGSWDMGAMMKEIERRKAAELASRAKEDGPNIWRKTPEQQAAIDSLMELTEGFGDVKRNAKDYGFSPQGLYKVMKAEEAFKKNDLASADAMLQDRDVPAHVQGMLRGILGRHADNVAALGAPGKKEPPPPAVHERYSTPPPVQQVRQRRSEPPASRTGYEAAPPSEPTTVIPTQAKPPSGLRGWLRGIWGGQ